MLYTKQHAEVMFAQVIFTHVYVVPLKWGLCEIFPKKTTMNAHRQGRWSVLVWGWGAGWHSRPGPAGEDTSQMFCHYNFLAL